MSSIQHRLEGFFLFVKGQSIDLLERPFGHRICTFSVYFPLMLALEICHVQFSIKTRRMRKCTSSRVLNIFIILRLNKTRPNIIIFKKKYLFYLKKEFFSWQSFGNYPFSSGCALYNMLYGSSINYSYP